MIPFYKLERLPRSLQLRKIIRIFAELEYRLRGGMDLSATEHTYLGNILELLVRDPAFLPEAALVIQDAAIKLKRSSPLDRAEYVLRPLNSIRHILLTEIGQFPADWDFIDPRGQLDPQKRRCFPGMRVYLEDIRAPFNVGAMFRTAESFGVETLFLSPLCADPHHPRSERTAMGCVSVLAWERLSRDKGIEKLGGPLFALETGGTRLGDFQFPPQGLMIVGSEELGVSPQVLALADASLGRVSIPTYGAKGSLNASVAFGIALQSWAGALSGETKKISYI